METVRVGDYGMIKFLAVVVLAVVIASLLVNWGNKAMHAYRIKNFVAENPGVKVPVSLMLGVTTPAAATPPTATPATAVTAVTNTGVVGPNSVPASVMP